MTLHPEAPGGRHRADESDDELRIARLADLDRQGRHAAPESARETFDPTVDDDPLYWLGFNGETA